MSKMRLATIIGIVGTAALVAVSLPVSRTKADHCHPNHDQTPNTNASTTGPRESVPARSSSLGRQRTRVGIPRAKDRLGRSGTVSLEEIYFRDLPTAVQSIDNATRAAEAGDNMTALAELLTARKILILTHEVLGKHKTPQFANSRCPIMGSPIDIDLINESLTREYKGWKVAFCCAQCPSAWDALSDPEKQAKVPGVKF